MMQSANGAPIPLAGPTLSKRRAAWASQPSSDEGLTGKTPSRPVPSMPMKSGGAISRGF
jgi:hypothetical protein